MAVAINLKSVFPFWLAASLVISPFLFLPLVTGALIHDNQRLIEISCVLFALGLVWSQWIKGSAIPQLLSRPITLLLALFFLLGLVSSGAAYSPRHAFLEWTNLFLLLGVAWLVAAEISAKGDQLLDKLLMLCGLACAAFLLLAIAIYFSVLKAGVQPKPWQLLFGFSNIRSFNYVQTISLPLLGLLAARMPDRGRQLFWWGITALWWMLLFVSAGRGTFVGLTFAIAIVWFSLRQAAGTWCRAMLLAGLAGLVGYLFFYVAIPLIQGLEPFGFFPTTVGRTLANPTSGRLLLWTRALEMIRENPWLGAGPVHFAHYGRDLQLGSSPHSWPLQMASEWGMPALLLLCGVLALAMRKLWQLRKTISAQDQDTHTAWLVTGLAILVDGFVSGLIVMPTSQLWIAMYVGCAWGWSYSRSPSVKTIDFRPSAVQRILISLVALLMSYALVIGIWPELEALSVLNTSYSKDTVLAPRIFSNGSF
ncbi:O-antigen ligase family protein [Rhodoferax sp.]|uniref:O-antigen ligase family protein n=1 Tax=Rhodoferax sp. TaxID=50421 RepID=UPI0025CE239D|nr:O-antigen ligase family protein [Rhodoferax sp.]MCM2342553.1 O-antigen ligase family protein [Rhodoferax sp.]